MPQPNDLSRSLVALDQNSTIIAVIEMSQSSWLVAGVLPGSTGKDGLPRREGRFPLD
jgi:transposase